MAELQNANPTILNAAQLPSRRLGKESAARRGPEFKFDAILAPKSQSARGAWSAAPVAPPSPPSSLSSGGDVYDGEDEVDGDALFGGGEDDEVFTEEPIDEQEIYGESPIVCVSSSWPRMARIPKDPGLPMHFFSPPWQPHRTHRRVLTVLLTTDSLHRVYVFPRTPFPFGHGTRLVAFISSWFWWPSFASPSPSSHCETRASPANVSTPRPFFAYPPSPLKTSSPQSQIQSIRTRWANCRLSTCPTSTSRRRRQPRGRGRPPPPRLIPTR